MERSSKQGVASDPARAGVSRRHLWSSTAVRAAILVLGIAGVVALAWVTRPDLEEGADPFWAPPELGSHGPKSEPAVAQGLSDSERRAASATAEDDSVRVPSAPLHSRPPMRLSIRVQGLDGQPLAGAAVRVSNRFAFFVKEADRIWEATSNDNGLAVLEDWPSGVPAIVSVTSPGLVFFEREFSISPLQYDQEVVQKAISQAGTIRGRLIRRSTMRAVAGSVDASFGGSIESGDFHDSSSGIEAASDKDGQFIMYGLSAGKWTAFVRSSSTRDRVMEFTLVSGEDRDLGDIFLEERLTLEGHLRNTNGSPRVGVRVSTREAAWRSDFGEHDDITDAVGRFRVQAASCMNGVQLWGWEAGSSDSVVRLLGSFDKPMSDLSLSWEQFGNLDVVVPSSGGMRPGTRVIVELEPIQARVHTRALRRIGKAGGDAIQFRSLPPGEYAIIAFGSEASRFRQRGFITIPESADLTRHTCILEEERTGPRIRIVDTSGVPISCVRVVCYQGVGQTDYFNATIRTTDFDGYAVLEGAAGKIRLNVRGAGLKSWSKKFDLPDVAADIDLGTFQLERLTDPQRAKKR
ncbi:MAG: hypothetical protein JNJ88_19240 [Planctomycetes bacterium]|nr:hypothetical protein [Planctomycetota bacterium]